jgi:hypothetical protein
MIIVIRGHIRNSFETNKLYDLIKKIHNIIPNLTIFIHTWNIFANNLSWRKIDTNNNQVTEEIIYKYFQDLKHLIKHIIIDDDTKIKLIGNLNGKIGKSLIPIRGWKNYWYGKYKIIDYLYNANIDPNEPIVNLRFDLMSNSVNFNETDIISFVKNNNKTKFTKNVFLFNDRLYTGADNIYIGNIETMHKLTSHFFYKLDDIINKNPNIEHPEYLVPMENSSLFGQSDVLQENLVSMEHSLSEKPGMLQFTHIDKLFLYLLFFIILVFIVFYTNSRLSNKYFYKLITRQFYG